MTTATETLDGTMSNAEATVTEGGAWINGLQERGREVWARRGFPSMKDEAWRDTNVSVLEKTPFVPAGVAPAKAAAELHARYTFGNAAGAEIVLVNGRFDAALSALSKLPAGVKVMTLARALAEENGLVERHLGAYAKIERHAFAARNTSHLARNLEAGVLVHVGKRKTCAKPLHILFLTVPSGEAEVTEPRVLVVAEENSESTIVETFAGNDGALYHTNAVTEIVGARSSRIDHCKLQQEGRGAYHTALMNVELAEQASFISHSLSVGSAVTRNDLEVLFNGERAEATLNGLVLANGEQHIDNHTLLHHEKGQCPSHELYKHVLNDKAVAVFMGKIFVQKDAQKTDSKQTSKALLLTDTAFMNSQPALEIYADDVKCTHGSTVGPVDANAVFYLVSRGLSLEQATHLMTYAFAADITRRIRVAPVRARMEDFMTAQHGLPQDLRITEEAAHDVALL